MSSNFKIGDLVWAKMKGFCPWPGMISDPPPELRNQKKAPNSHYVYFFGSNNYAFVKKDSIKPYQEFKEIYTKTNKLNSLKHAVDEIEKYILNPNKYLHIKGSTNNVKAKSKPPRTPKVLAKKVKNKPIVPRNNNRKTRIIEKVLKNNKNYPTQKKVKENLKKKEDVLKNKKVNEVQEESQEDRKLDEKENVTMQPPRIQLCDISVVVERNVFQCQTCNMIFLSNRKLNIHKRIHTKKIEKKSHKRHNHVKNKISKKPKIKIRLQLKKNCKTSFIDTLKKTFPNGLKKLKEKRTTSSSKKQKQEVHDLEKQVVHDLEKQEVHVSEKQDARSFEKHTQFVCPYCERIMITEHNLLSHMKLHKDGGLYCHICGKTFIQQNILNRHLKRHEGIRDHVCPQCDKGFFDRKSLNRHLLQVHSDERPFACEYCEKTFKDRKSVKRHMFTHLEVKD